jgi:undecaprenyl diphosphate synthase
LKQHLPKHVAIIMDGNGRWALSRGQLRVEGHRAGADSVRTVVDVCLQKKIPALSLFAFSSENWSRPAEEVNFLMDLFLQFIRAEIENLMQKNICLRFSGDRGILNDELQLEMERAEDKTAANSDLLLNVMINYGGKWDITQAMRKLCQQVESGTINTSDIDEAVIARHLSNANFSDPDLFIRTSGERRISNFFLWQLAYSELYFTETLWPDFNALEFEKALKSFALRKRRFGGIEQSGNPKESHV